MSTEKPQDPNSPSRDGDTNLETQPLGKPEKPRLPWGWVGFFGVIVMLALLSFFAVLQGTRQLAEQAPEMPALVRVIIGGHTHLIDEQTAANLSPVVRRTVSERRLEAVQTTARQIDQRIDEIFAPALSNIAQFSDWYYSLQGEYMRYAHALGGDLTSYLQQRLNEEVFQAAHLETALDQALLDWNSHALEQLQTTLSAVIEELQRLITAESQPIAEGLQEQVQIQHALDLDQLLQARLTINEQDINRQIISLMLATGVGTAIGKGFGALVVKSTLSKIAATKGFQTAVALLAKLAAKSALKGGTTLGAAATGLAVCSPGGPAALLCGIAAGLVTWIAVDKAIIELEEALHREEFEGELRGTIEQQREQLKQELKSAYGTVLEDHFRSMEEQLGRELKLPADEFVPAKAL